MLNDDEDDKEIKDQMGIMKSKLFIVVSKQSNALLYFVCVFKELKIWNRFNRFQDKESTKKGSGILLFYLFSIVIVILGHIYSN